MTGQPRDTRDLEAALADAQQQLAERDRQLDAVTTALTTGLPGMVGELTREQVREIAGMTVRELITQLRSATATVAELAAGIRKALS